MYYPDCAAPSSDSNEGLREVTLSEVPSVFLETKTDKWFTDITEQEQVIYVPIGWRSGSSPWTVLFESMEERGRCLTRGVTGSLRLDSFRKLGGRLVKRLAIASSTSGTGRIRIRSNKEK